MFQNPTNKQTKERNAFYSLQRKDNENPRKWLLRISHKLKKCNYPKKTNKFFLHDKFVCGLNKIEKSKLPEKLTIRTVVEFVKEKTQSNVVSLEAIMKV